MQEMILLGTVAEVDHEEGPHLIRDRDLVPAGILLPDMIILNPLLHTFQVPHFLETFDLRRRHFTLVLVLTTETRHLQ